MNHPDLLYLLAVDRQRELIAQADAHRLARQARGTRTPSQARRLWRRLLGRNTNDVTTPDAPPAVTPPQPTVAASQPTVVASQRASQSAVRPAENVETGHEHEHEHDTELSTAGCR